MLSRSSFRDAARYLAYPHARAELPDQLLRLGGQNRVVEALHALAADLEVLARQDVVHTAGPCAGEVFVGALSSRSATSLPT